MLGLSKETLDNFLMNNDITYPLYKSFNLKVNYIFINKQELRDLFKNHNGWDEFYKKYPDSQGILTLSKVGFNKKLNQSLIYYGNQSNWLAGTGYLVFLTKKNNIWKIKKEIMIWIS